VGAVQPLGTPVDAVRCRRIRAAVRTSLRVVVVAVATPQWVRCIPAVAATGAVRADTDTHASRLNLPRF